MDIIEIIPPKHLNFSLPTDLHRVLTVTNLTLHSVYVGIVNSHHYQISLSHDWFMLQAFEQKKIDVTINWNQESKNLSMGKLRVFYVQIEQEVNEDQIRKDMFKGKAKYYYEELTVFINLDIKALNFLNYQVTELEGNTIYEPISQQFNKKYFLMKRVTLIPRSQNEQKKIRKNQILKNQILSYLQQLLLVQSIQTCDDQSSFLVQFSSQKEDSCDFISYQVQNQTHLYVIKRIVAYGKTNQMQTLVNIDDQIQLKKENKASQDFKPTAQQPIKKQPSKNTQFNLSPSNKKQQPNEKLQYNDLKERKKKELIKQSFVNRKQTERGRHKRRNKSQEKIIERQFEQSQDEDQLFKDQMRELARLANNANRLNPQSPQTTIEQTVIKKVIKINQTNIQMSNKILNIYLQKKQFTTEVYVLLRDCVRCYILEQPLAKKIIKFDPIYEENINMPTPVDIYKQQLIFGNQTCLFWVNLQSGESQWKYVQRKYIYAISVIQELSLAAVGGKNFSKLAYFGKETSRSNIKLYSCSSSDKHQHLYTYDIPGNNVGNVMNMAYVSAPPHGTKLLIVHTVNAEGISTFHFLRVKAFNKVEVFGQIDLDELGILKLLKFKYNKQSGRVICMEALGETEMDSFKKLKLKCQYEKVEVSTEGCKFPLKRYISFHLGGCKQDSGKEWMSMVDENGCLFHLYDFDANELESFDLGKGEIKQVFSVYNGKFLLICAQSFIRIRQKVQIFEK